VTGSGGHWGEPTAGAWATGPVGVNAGYRLLAERVGFGEPLGRDLGRIPVVAVGNSASRVRKRPAQGSRRAPGEAAGVATFGLGTARLVPTRLGNPGLDRPDWALTARPWDWPFSTTPAALSRQHHDDMVRDRAEPGGKSAQRLDKRRACRGQRPGPGEQSGQPF